MDFSEGHADVEHFGEQDGIEYFGEQDDIEYLGEYDDDFDGSEPGPPRKRWTFAARLILVLLAVSLLSWSIRAANVQALLDFVRGGSAASRGAESVPKAPTRVLQDGVWVVTYTFMFDGKPRHVVARISQADRATSAARPRVMEVPSGQSRDEAIRHFYLRFLDWPEQQRAIDGLLPQFRAIRTSEQLGSDDYVRLLNAFVGTIPYDQAEADSPDGARRLPSGMLADARGVCEEKSQLLGGLLAAEGYDAALLLLEGDDHMAVGVRSDTHEFKGTPYVFIDAVGTTVRTAAGDYQIPVLVGDGAGKYKSQPIIVPLRTGGTRYQ